MDELFSDKTILELSDVKDKEHFLLHLKAVIKDAEGIKDEKERERVILGAKTMIDGKIVLQVDKPYRVHDYIEKIETREEING